jgi:hypothetical protein
MWRAKGTDAASDLGRHDVGEMGPAMVAHQSEPTNATALARLAGVHFRTLSGGRAACEDRSV